MLGKKGPAVDIVFGMGKPKKSGGEDHDESRDMLIGALGDAGIDGDKAEALADALHDYIMSCTSGGEAGEEAAPESDKGY